MLDFTPKVPTDQEIFTFDYAPDLAVSELIVSAAWGCSVLNGVDAGAASMISGAASVSSDGSQVSQMVINGLTGVTYLLQCHATSSLGQIITKYGRFLCQNPG